MPPTKKKEKKRDLSSWDWTKKSKRETLSEKKIPILKKTIKLICLPIENKDPSLWLRFDDNIVTWAASNKTELFIF
jgi:hypothetical protein